MSKYQKPTDLKKKKKGGKCQLLQQIPQESSSDTETDQLYEVKSFCMFNGQKLLKKKDYTHTHTH